MRGWKTAEAFVPLDRGVSLSFSFRRTASLLPALLLACTLTLICAVVAGLLYDGRLEQFRRASAEAVNLSAIISQDIARNVEFFDLSLQGVIDDLKIPEVMASPVALRRLILFDRAATAPYLGAIRVLDTSGNIVIDSRDLQPRALNFADREYFRVQAEKADVGLYIGKPIISRTDGQLIIGMSRRINNPDGSFGGVVVGTLHLEYLHRLFAGTKLGPNGSLTLFRDDGTVLMREPFTSAVGTLVRPPLLFARLATSRDGQYQARSAVDGVERLIHYHKIGTLPLIQDVALSVRDIYADWWRKAIGIAAVLLLCCVIIAGLAYWLSRELHRRLKAEASLVLLADEDGLTGLANRRRFDATLRTEWTLAARQNTSLSLLIIDADQFKAYNDAFGHPAGDDALSQLATCLKSSARRPSDLAARYGGEEFAIILPSTPAQDAMIIAETVRKRILDLALPHPGLPWGAFSVSIGVATCVPGQKATSADLLAAADAALYASKKNGRNRSEHQRLFRRAA